MAVASARPYTSLHLARDRQPRQHPTAQFLQAGCPSCRPTNSIKALKAYMYACHEQVFTGQMTYPLKELKIHTHTHAGTHAHTRTFNGPFSGTTQVSRYQKGKTDLDFTEARGSEWQWHQLGHMQVCTLLQTDNHASTPPLCFLQAGCPSCRPTNSVRALKATQNKPQKNTKQAYPFL